MGEKSGLMRHSDCTRRKRGERGSGDRVEGCVKDQWVIFLHYFLAELLGHEAKQEIKNNVHDTSSKLKVCS